ncbi:hypothetical protein BQ8794_260024 [Mesorhizobium prunaredense]|uniref:Transposase n=1 Tax=Mesorhizobium prunaredense TaxID=1631249 RepID=A0A1R3V8D0_9HYPH|nr:hypothetical protein BQ8794_260024 [Mesorhizobium prunaredense]
MRCQTLGKTRACSKKPEKERRCRVSGFRDRTLKNTPSYDEKTSVLAIIDDVNTNLLGTQRLLSSQFRASARHKILVAETIL